MDLLVDSVDFLKLALARFKTATQEDHDLYDTNFYEIETVVYHLVEVVIGLADREGV